MQQLIMYSLPEDDTQHPRVTYNGNPIINPQIQEIFSRLRQNETFDFLGDGRLCNVCAELNLCQSSFDVNDNSDTSPPRYDSEREDKTMPLGRFKDVLDRQDHCALCRLIARILDEEHKLHNGGASADWEGSNAMAEVALVWTRHEDLQEVQNNPHVYRLRVQLTTPDADGKGNPGFYKSKVMIEPFSALEQEDPEVLMGRVYGEGQIDVGLLKAWIQCCDEWHTGECKTSFREELAHPAAEFTVYGIDVHAMQLKTLAEGDRYCALSYVWGRKPFYRLLVEDLAKLLAAPGSIDVQKLPQTIVAAMGLARDLEIPYLWVDAVCIPQDDDAYKAAAIGKMHLVYSKAELTIVAASGPDSFYGLPGYGGVPRDMLQPVQRVKSNGEDLVLGVRRRYQWTLAKSPHGERGWTYQEMCFSTRCLVFLNGTAYFQCRQAVWREDWTLEHPTAVRFFLHEMDNRFMQNTDLLGQYRHSLREYTRRKLTYQDDAVNAYAGVLAAQPALFGGFPLGPACCGLHIGLIDWVILFYLGRGATRHRGMPSWSWAGWVGEAFLPYPMFGSILRLISWEQEHCPAGITHFEDLGFLGIPGIKHVLRVTTLSATLLLDPETLDGPGFLNPLWRLRDCRGRACGFISLHQSTFWDAFPPMEALVVEILVLSDRVPGQGQYPHLGSHIPYDPENRNEDGTLGPRRWEVAPFTGYEGKVRAELKDKPFGQYNVLVAVPRTATVGEERYSGFHERIGVGVIHNQALSWAVGSPPSRKEIFIL